MLTVRITSGKYRNDFDHYIVYGSTKRKFLIFDRGWIWVNHIDCLPGKTQVNQNIIRSSGNIQAGGNVTVN